jgi:hypothetical protein
MTDARPRCAKIVELDQDWHWCCVIGQAGDVEVDQLLEQRIVKWRDPVEFVGRDAKVDRHAALAKASVLNVAIYAADDTASFDVALGMARQCGMKLDEAREIVGEVQAAVSHWRASSTSHGLNARGVARMCNRRLSWQKPLSNLSLCPRLWPAASAIVLKNR